MKTMLLLTLVMAASGLTSSMKSVATTQEEILRPRRWTASEAAASDCQIPESWHGSWYHHGFPQPLNITAGHITSKGTCVQQEGSRFIMEDR